MHKAVNTMKAYNKRTLFTLNGSIIFEADVNMNVPTVHELRVINAAMMPMERFMLIFECVNINKIKNVEQY